MRKTRGEERQIKAVAEERRGSAWRKEGKGVEGEGWRKGASIEERKEYQEKGRIRAMTREHYRMGREIRGRGLKKMREGGRLRNIRGRRSGED